MGQFETLTRSAEDYCVITDDIAFTNRLNRNFAVDLPRPFYDFAQRFGRSARRVFFHFVMCLGNLRSKLVAEQLGRFGREPK